MNNVPIVFTTILAGTMTYIISSNSKQISDYISSAFDTIYNYFVKTIVITNDFNTMKTRDALLDYINNNCTASILQLSDGLNYQIMSGKFIFIHCDKKIYINITKDQIILSTCGNIDTIKNFIKSVYDKYDTKDNILYYYTSCNGIFKLGIPKRPRIKFPDLTQSMDLMLRDIDDFMDPKNITKYNCSGIPHRKGYLIHGLPGTGKSAIVEKIVTKWNMNLYVIVFNDSAMTDSTLITLFNQVPMNSVILIDEIDKQLETISINTNKNLSYGGILSAMAGAERLSQSVIIILTANDIGKLDPTFKQSLLRVGRIDQTYEFKEPFVQTI